MATSRPYPRIRTFLPSYTSRRAKITVSPLSSTFFQRGWRRLRGWLGKIGFSVSLQFQARNANRRKEQARMGQVFPHEFFFSIDGAEFLFRETKPGREKLQYSRQIGFPRVTA
jgi:hypothetical protein